MYRVVDEGVEPRNIVVEGCPESRSHAEVCSTPRDHEDDVPCCAERYGSVAQKKWDEGECECGDERDAGEDGFVDL